jgi:hypothetical protein
MISSASSKRRRSRPMRFVLVVLLTIILGCDAFLLGKFLGAM